MGTVLLLCVSIYEPALLTRLSKQRSVIQTHPNAFIYTRLFRP